MALMALMAPMAPMAPMATMVSIAEIADARRRTGARSCPTGHPCDSPALMAPVGVSLRARSAGNGDR